MVTLLALSVVYGVALCSIYLPEPVRSIFILGVAMTLTVALLQFLPGYSFQYGN